jgi:hypothetical protein
LELLNKVVEIFYYDHYGDSHLDPRQVDKDIPCRNSNLGKVVYEDDDWVRIRHGRMDLDGPDEDWEISGIRKCDIYRVDVYEAVKQE